MATDHKPLLNILNDRSLADIPNRRLMNLKEKTLSYRFKIVHVPGRKHLGPDAASRYPSGAPKKMELAGEPPETDMTGSIEDQSNRNEIRTSVFEGLRIHEEDDDEQSLECCLVSKTMAALSTIPVLTWNDIRLTTASNPELVELSKVIEEGFPSDKTSLPAQLQPYAPMADQLLILRRGRHHGSQGGHP